MTLNQLGGGGFQYMNPPNSIQMFFEKLTPQHYDKMSRWMAIPNQMVDELATKYDIYIKYTNYGNVLGHIILDMNNDGQCIDIAYTHGMHIHMLAHWENLVKEHKLEKKIRVLPAQQPELVTALFTQGFIGYPTNHPHMIIMDDVATADYSIEALEKINW